MRYCPAGVYEYVERRRRRTAPADQRAELRALQDLRHQGPAAEHRLGDARRRRRAELPGHVVRWHTAGRRHRLQPNPRCSRRPTSCSCRPTSAATCAASTATSGSSTTTTGRATCRSIVAARCSANSPSFAPAARSSSAAARACSTSRTTSRSPASRRALGLRCLSVINGTRVRDPERADRMVLAGPHEISVSLNSHRPDLHDRTRGVKGAFTKAVKALRLLLEARARHRTPTAHLRDGTGVRRELSRDRRFLRFRAERRRRGQAQAQLHPAVVRPRHVGRRVLRRPPPHRCGRALRHHRKMRRQVRARAQPGVARAGAHVFPVARPRATTSRAAGARAPAPTSTSATPTSATSWSTTTAWRGCASRRCSPASH